MFKKPNQEYVDKRVLDPKFKKYAVAMIESETFANAVTKVGDALKLASVEFMQKTRFGMEVQDFFFGKPGPTPLPGVFLEPARDTKGVWMVWMYFTTPETEYESLRNKLDNVFFPMAG
jgi:hypothetical protein